jgi:hypothetical protein
MHVCHDRGYLVADDRWLPVDAVDYYGASYGMFVGCNRLTCTRCRQPVRHALGYWEVPAVEPARLYAATSWDAVAPPVEHASGRLYACACHAVVAHAPIALAQSADDEYEERPPWQCAGHPAFVPPGTIAGIAIARPPDWPALVAAHLEAAGGVHPSVDALPGFALTRLFRALDDRGDRAELGAAVGARGGDRSERSRQAAALFFALNPDAPGFGDVLAAWRDQPARYDDLAAPWGPEPRLRHVVLEAIASRLAPRRPPDDDARATWRWAATRAPGLGSHLFRVRYVDESWAVDHVDELLAAAPGDWERVVRAIRVPDVKQLVPACRAAIAAGHATRDRVGAVLAEIYGAAARSAVDDLS